MAVIIIDEDPNHTYAIVTIPGKLAALFKGSSATLDRRRGAWLLPLEDLDDFTAWVKAHGHIPVRADNLPTRQPPLWQDLNVSRRQPPAVARHGATRARAALRAVTNPAVPDQRQEPTS